ncbi:MAG: hypothetical protein LCI02_12500 [Proteobacteria bacterium]|nr:hypothetical protein [Pseudomonadota bacterium]
MEWLGIDKPPMAYSELPDLRDYTVKELGLLGSIGTRARRGDYELTREGAPTHYLNRDVVGTYGADFLANRGVQGLRRPK